MELLLVLPLIISFFASFIIVYFWIKKAKNIELVWEDINKYKMPKVAGSGGIAVIVGFMLGIFFFIALRTFVFKSNDNLIEIFALTSSIFILAGIGIIDDLLGWGAGGISKRLSGGLSKKFRLFLCLLAAIPFIVINAGVSKVGIPLIDGTNLGLIYPLIIIPLGIIGASTTFNFLAGFNGLESGEGILILSALSLVSYLTGNSWLALTGLIMVFSLLGFWLFNKYPAKVFPGDILTYPVGGMIAIMAILGNMERIAVFFFIPYILEVFLKLRGKLKKYSFGKPNKDGSLEMSYNKIYGLGHFAIWFLKKFKNKVYEKEVVYFIYIFQIIIILLGLIIFRNSIF